MPRALYSDAYVTVTLDPKLGLVRYVRSALPYATLEAVGTTHAAVTRALRAEGGAELKLLLDSRAAPPRNDPAFETEIVRWFQSFAMLFTARASLIQSAAGKLQVQRLGREAWSNAPGPPAAFTSEAEALAYLGVVPGA